MTTKAAPLRSMIFLSLAWATNAYVQGECPSNAPKQVTDSQGSCGCTGRPDGARCPYYTKEHPYGVGTCSDGIWCEYFQSKCLNEKCGPPAETLCITAGGILCGGGAPYCYSNSTNHKFCLSHDVGVCLGKEYGAACTTNRGEPSLCLDSRHEGGYLRYSVECADTNCYKCVAPENSACYNKTELQGCLDYQKLSYNRHGIAEGVKPYQGGTCNLRQRYGVNYHECIGAIRENAQTSDSSVRGLPAVFFFAIFAARHM